MAEPRHLDAQALASLDRGDEAARAHFAEHLAQPCEVCESFLAAQELLDGAADAVLLGGAREDATLDEVGFRRIRNTVHPERRAAGTESKGQSSSPEPAGPAASTPPLRGDAQPERGRPERRRRFVAVFGSLAAALIAFAGVWTVLGNRPVDPNEGIKSVAAALTLELQAARRDSAGSVHRVDPRALVPASGELMFRSYATEKGGAWLFVKRAGGEPEPLGSFALEPGAHPLTLGSGEVAALTLEEESGALTLWLVGSAGSAPALDAARRAIEAPVSPGLAVARLDLTVISERDR